MLEIYQTPLDFLYLVLSISIGLFALFLVIALFHTISILRNVKKVTSKAKDTVDLVNHYLWQPIKIAMMMFEKGTEAVAKQQKRNAKKKSK